jgi:hypothetical protein
LNTAKKASDNLRALLLTNIGQLLTLRSDKSDPRRAPALSHLALLEGAAVLCQAARSFRGQM